MKIPGPVEVGMQQLVELAQKLTGARRHEPFRQEHRARLGHEQRGADAVPGHVADETVHAVGATREIAEIVAAHRVRRNAAARIAHAADRERVFRQQRVLDLLRNVHVRARHGELDFRLAGSFPPRCAAPGLAPAVSWPWS